MKVCIRCQEDCSNRPRVRDPQGRYVCKRCLQKAVDQKHGGSADAKPSRQRSTPKPAPVEQPMFEDVDTDFLASYQDQPEGMAMPAQQQQAGPMRTCLNCKQPMSADAVVCMQCGYNAQTGRKMKTRTIKTRQPKEKKESRLAQSGAQGALVAFVLGTIVAVGLTVGAWNNVNMLMVAGGVLGLFSFVSGIAIIVTAFMDSIAQGFLTMCIPFYAIYWVFFRSENFGIMALFGLNIVVTVCRVALQIHYMDAVFAE